MPDPVHIGIALDFHYEYARAVMRGIVSYARPDRPWNFHILSECPEKCRQHPHLQKLRGALGAFACNQLADTLHAAGIPIINIANRHSPAPLPRVGPDNFGIGRLVARHFLDRGFSHFAFIDADPPIASSEREKGFAEELAGASMTFSPFHRWLESHHPEHPGRTEAIRAWLATLPRPLALFASSDAVAWPVIDLCREEAIAVPESVAIVSVDNDPMICLVTSPTLSSVALPAERIGYEAAALLDRMLAGQPAPETPLLIPAKEVVSRQSSDTLAMPDPELASAVRYIRQHAGNRIGVRDVVKATHVARRSLERKFRAVLGRSPLEEIRRARLDRVRELLVNTDLSMPVIARRSGFDSAVRLTTVFREATGITPTHFRRQFRMTTPDLLSEELDAEQADAANQDSADPDAADQDAIDSDPVGQDPVGSA